MCGETNLSVLIPYYNEDRNLAKLVEKISEADKNKQFIYIFIDDGSSDNSREFLISALEDTSLRYFLINHESNLGKSAAVQSALNSVTTSHFAILDADLELEPRDIHRMWNIIESGIADAVFGFRRFLSHSSFTYRYTLGNKFICHWFGIFYNVVHTDIMCGLKLLPTQLIKDEGLRLRNFAIEIEIPMILWRNGIQVYELEVDYSPRGWREGKVIGILDALYILLSISTKRVLIDRRKVKNSASFKQRK
jgi:glycosyltransferase involved in cell wall biosynthesis